MRLQNFVFYISLIVLLKPSLQQDQDDYDWDDYERDYETYEIEQEHDSVTIVPVPRIFEQQQEYDKSDTKVSVLEEIRNISVDKGSDLVLTCLPNGNKATWLDIQHNSQVSISTTSNGISELSIKNVLHDCTYDCQQPNNIVQRFVVTVHAPQATILHQSSGMVQNGSNIHISCVVRSIISIDTAYLRVDNTHTSHKYIAYWESRKRVCVNNDYNRTDCVVETTFQYDTEIGHNGNYSCGYENAESDSLFVEVIDRDAIIHEATEICAEKRLQENFIQFAIEALEKYGLKQDTANYIREKCNIYSLLNYRDNHSWNCIIGKQTSEFSLSPDIFEKPHSSFRFSLGPIIFSIFRTEAKQVTEHDYDN